MSKKSDFPVGFYAIAGNSEDVHLVIDTWRCAGDENGHGSHLVCRLKAVQGPGFDLQGATVIEYEDDDLLVYESVEDAEAGLGKRAWAREMLDSGATHEVHDLHQVETEDLPRPAPRFRWEEPGFQPTEYDLQEAIKVLKDYPQHKEQVRAMRKRLREMQQPQPQASA